MDINKIEREWLYSILEKIYDVIYSNNYNEEEKIKAIEWLVKQGFKIDREE